MFSRMEIKFDSERLYNPFVNKRVYFSATGEPFLCWSNQFKMY